MTCRLSFCMLFLALAGQAHAQPPVPPGVEPGESYHRMFVTLEPLVVGTLEFVPPFLPVFGGLDAADWAVTFYASQAGLLDPFLDGGTWNNADIYYQAVLSTQTMRVVDLLDIQGAIYNTNDDLIATGAADLWDGSIANPVGYDEFGVAVATGTKVWTGSDSLGNRSNFSCEDWNNPSGAGNIGFATESDTSWIGGPTQSCSLSARLYGMSLAITLPDSADFNGDNVVDGLDFLTLQRGLGTVGPSATHANGDANGDDLINDADLAVWEAQYGSAPPLSAVSAAVPEPTTSALALAALCLVMGRRRGI